MQRTEHLHVSISRKGTMTKPGIPWVPKKMCALSIIKVEVKGTTTIL